VVVTVGLAVTVEPVVALRPVAGCHVKVAAPPAVMVVDVPEQIFGLAGVAVTVRVPTLITTDVVLLHAPLLPVTVYVVVEPGLAVGLLQLVQLNPPGGLHK
jgi:hypothetical protein